MSLTQEITRMKKDNQSVFGFSTRAIHEGYDPMDEGGSLTPPLHLTSTFCFETAEAGGEMFAGERSGHIYSRISNPTLDLLERRIASLEGAEAGACQCIGYGGHYITDVDFCCAG